MSVESPPFDSVLNPCQHQHHRIVLGRLVDEQESVTLDDLTKAILERNHQTPLTEASEGARTTIRLSLHHVHRPKSAAGGLIDYDSERRLAEPTEQLAQVRPTLTPILEADSSLEVPMKL